MSNLKANPQNAAQRAALDLVLRWQKLYNENVDQLIQEC